MSVCSYLSSTSFTLSKEKGDEACIAAIEGLIASHFDGDYDIELTKSDVDHQGCVKYCLDLDVGEVGDSFASSVMSFAKKLEPFVGESFCITVRNDSMSDDRDTEIFCGPTPEAIANFRAAYALGNALECLHGPSDSVKHARAILMAVSQKLWDEKMKAESEKAKKPMAIFVGSIADGFAIEQIVDDAKTAEDIVIAHLANGQIAEAVEIRKPSSCNKNAKDYDFGMEYIVFNEKSIGAGFTMYGPFPDYETSDRFGEANRPQDGEWESLTFDQPKPMQFEQHRGG